jgi:hypothetical protein
MDLPAYILRRVTPSPEIRYVWDDWNTEQVEEPPNAVTMEVLGGVSLRGVLAFTISSAEWVLARYVGMVDLSLPQDYVEASWIAQIDRGYIAMEWEDHPEAESWTGPVRGPIGIAMTRVMYAAQQVESRENPELRAGWITNLVTHILPDPRPYVEWREWVLARFRAIYLRNEEDPLGTVIAPENCDPDHPASPEETEEAMNRLLAVAATRKNPFLLSPADAKRRPADL